jgi:2'-hydroxyisoflavone reductase
MGEMVGGIRAAIPGDLDVKFTWVPSDFLREQRVNGWSHMPVWVAARPGNDGWSRVSIKRAVEKGLTFRPLAETVQATLEWHKTRPAEQQAIPRGPRAAQSGPGILPERETALLTAWKAKAVS